MTKFAKFDKTTLKTLRSEMQSLLEKYGMDSNLQIEVGNMRFSAAEVEIKVKAKIKGAKTRSESMLETMANLKGLQMKNAYGDELVDYNVRAHKMPYIYKCGKTGKMFKCDETTAKMRFSA